MGNDRFEAYTRSTAFSLTLSGRMVGELTRLHLAAELCDRYPWYEPWQEHRFGTIEESMWVWSTSTVRALAKRGLVDIAVPDRLPVAYHQVVKLTAAGHLVCELLLEAGFERTAPPCLVPPHPDDRIPLDVGVVHQRPTPHDRRLDLMIESDRPYLSLLREAVSA